MIDSIHQSHINTWLRCGVQFERRYINGEIIPPGVAARRGSAAHKGAEINHVSMIEKGEILPLDVLTDATRDEFVRLVKEEGVFIPLDQKSEANAILNENMNQALSAIGKYHEVIAPSIKPIAAELKITVDIGLPLPIAGIIDCVEEKTIRDLKIRGKATNQQTADAGLQPSFYYELFRAQYGDYPAEFIYDEIVPLKTKTSYNPITTRRNKATQERWRHYLKAFLRDLDAGIWRPADPGSFLCSPKWCGYYQTCPYGALHRIAA